MEITTLSAEDLLGARAATELVLDAIGLANYRFDVEPREGGFEVFVEHERGGAWHVVQMTESAASLLGVRRDASARDDVVRRWRARLCGHD